MVNFLILSIIVYFLGKGFLYAELVYFIIAGLSLTSFLFMQKRKGVLFNILASVFFCELIIAKVDLNQLKLSLKEVNPFLFLLSNFFICFAIFFKLVRWESLLLPIKNLHMKTLLTPLMIGLFLNGTLPARAGDFASSYILGRKENVSSVSIFATLFIEKIFDGILILSMLIGVMFFYRVNSTIISRLQYLAIAFYFSLIFLMFLIYFKKSLLITLLEKIKFLGLGEKLAPILNQFADGLQIIKKMGQFTMVSFFSLLMWISIVFSKIPILLAFNHLMPIYTPFLLTAVTSLSMLLPSVGGGLGVFHYAVILCLQAVSLNISAGNSYTISMNEALAIGVALHLALLLPDILLGFLFFIGSRFTEKSDLYWGTIEITLKS